MKKTLPLVMSVLFACSVVATENDIDILIEMAKSGDAEAQAVLGCAYYLGSEEHALKPNPEEAYKWLISASKKGDLDRESNFFLGMCLRNGEGTSENKGEGFKYIKLSAEQDYVPALYELGRCYYDGWGCETNINMAIQYWDKAAETGDPDSLFMLGMQYAVGQGVEQDFLKAQGLFGKAASLGHEQAKEAFELGKRLKHNLSDRKHIVYIVFMGTSSSEAADITPTPINIGYAIDLDTGEFFSEGGHLITKFKNIDDDILYAERIEPNGVKFIYQFNRISGTANIRAYQNGSTKAIVVQTGTFVKKDRDEKIF